MKNILKSLFLMLLITSIGCNKNKEIIKTDEANVNHSEVLRVANNVVCEDGVLVFSNWDVYYQMDSALSTYTFEEKKAWEDALSFKSQKQIFDNIAAKEYDIFITPYENMPESYFQENPEPDHCAEYYVTINNGMIKDVYDEGHYMDYTVKDISKVAFINAEGFIKIDSILYQYKGDLIKYMINGSIQDCDLLNSTNESDEDLDIIVAKVPEGGTGGEHGGDGDDNGGNYDGPFYKKGFFVPKDWVTSASGKCRAKCSTFVEIKGHGSPNMYEYTFQLDCKPLIFTLESQQKNGWGNWHMYHGEYNVSGMTSITISEGTGALNNPPTNPQPYYPDFMINFQTIHGNTGSNYFPVTVSKNMVYYNGIVWTSAISRVFWCPANINPIHFDITADIAGGSSGITVQNTWQ